MERKKMLYWGVQFVGWTTYFLFSVLLLYSTEDLKLTFNLFAFATLSIFTSIFISHGIRYVIIKRKIIGRSLGQLILSTLIMCMLSGFILELTQYQFEHSIEIDYLVNPHHKLDSKFAKGQTYSLEEERCLYQENRSENGMLLIEAKESSKNDFNFRNFLFPVSRSIILFLLWCGFYYAFSIAEKSRAQEILSLKWEASKNEIELKNLRAQLNPHFLFNSLNSIRALIGLNPNQAKTSVTQLSNLLRKSINLGKMKVIPLKEELDLVKTYLDLEQVRFEERLRTDFRIEPKTLSCEIPPLMIQTIVENGIKHGISQSIDGGIISVYASLMDNKLEIIVSNSGNLNENNKGVGVGISNSKKRLAILFGENADFKMYQEADNVVVKINIKYT